MKKILFVFLLFILFFISGPSTYAIAPTQRWVCLDVAPYRPDQDKPKQCTKENLCRGILTVKPNQKPLPNADTYIIECINTNQGRVCTTANSTLDTLIYDNDNYSRLKNDPTLKYTYGGIFKSDGVTPATNPTKTNATGDMGPFQWQSYTVDPTERTFFALNFGQEESAPDEFGGGQQQATFTFEEAARKNCVSIRWDPYGRIFDSKSLEPIPNAVVSLNKKRDNGSYTRVTQDEIIGEFANPIITREDGAFTFLVPDGIYTLSVSHAGYIFPGKSDALHPNYIKIYEDIYPYVTGEEIIQAGKIQHRDIPLDSATGQSYPPKIIDYAHELDKLTNTVIVKGRVSHPFAKITVNSKKIEDNGDEVDKYRAVKMEPADKMGGFSIEVKQSELETNEVVGQVEIEKMDLTRTSLSSIINSVIREIYAQDTNTSTIELIPILNYVEGYIYDTAGKVIPNATVGVYMTFSNTAYFETKTDQSGYIKISSENLPWMPFELRYTSPNGAVTDVSTTRFIVQNSKLLKENGIDLNTYTKVSTVTGETEQIVPTEGVSQQELTKANQSSAVLMIAIILGILGVIGIIIAVGLLKRKKNLSNR